MNRYIEKIAGTISVQDHMKMLATEAKELGQIADDLSRSEVFSTAHQELLTQFMITLVAMRSMVDDVVWSSMIDIDELSLWELWYKKLIGAED